MEVQKSDHYSLGEAGAGSGEQESLEDEYLNTDGGHPLMLTWDD